MGAVVPVAPTNRRNDPDEGLCLPYHVFDPDPG
jgi:hypothetical protein